MIDGVRVRELRKNVDDRGYLMEVLRSDWGDVFQKFGQAYVSFNHPGVIRGWHYHSIQYDLFVCVAGMIKVPLYDARVGSVTHRRIDEYVVGVDRPLAILIPPGVYHGYVTLGVEPSMLLNFPSELYRADQPDEHRVPYDSAEIGYDWSIRFR